MASGERGGTTGRPRLQITPDVALIDEPVRVRVQGCTPGETVRLLARTTDEQGRVWTAEATPRADASGCVDLSRDASEFGTYHGVDAMGLFWSMRLDAAATTDQYYKKSTLSPEIIVVSIETRDATIASALVERRFIGPDVLRVPVRERGLIGTLFRPDDDEPRPAVIVLGGDGGLHEHGAALLASRGFAALALAYFGVEGLPERCVEIPLEYGLTAIQWLQSQDWVRPDKIVVVGSALGGELALLLGATYPQVSAVVAYTPMTLVVAGRGPSGASEPLWTCDGEPVPYALDDDSTLDTIQARWAHLRQAPYAPAARLRRRLRNRSWREAGAIPVERIRGPVLLLSAKDDSIIPSYDLCELAIERLRAYRHSHAYKHVAYEGAGHAIGLPLAHGLPNMPTYARAPAASLRIKYGGNPRDNARANQASWQELLAFLRATS